jgi:hypothetical protein
MTSARKWATKPLKDASKRLQYDTARDIELERQRQALVSTAAFVDEHMASVTPITGSDVPETVLDVLRDALGRAEVPGLTLEFGVATGFTLRELVQHRKPVYGFDSFEGLPESWRAGYREGAFAQSAPQIEGAELVVGWFDQTLPGFLEDHQGPISFVHMDADLYSSTKTIFDLAFDRFVPGSVIVFNEYFNYPGWQQHEHKAFLEFLDAYPGGFEYLNYNAIHEQVSVILT